MSVELILPPMAPLIRAFLVLVISISSTAPPTCRIEILDETAPFGLIDLLPLRFLVILFFIFLYVVPNFFY